MKGLHSIRPSKGSTKTVKRVGRGNSSGKGTYAGRGLKGQRARAGGRKGLIQRSMRQYMLRIPKSRGFTSHRDGYVVVNLGDLQQRFNDGDTVSLKSLRSKGLITHSSDRVKILSAGSLQKKLMITAHSFSASAKVAIEKAGGSAIVIVRGGTADASVSTVQK